MTYMSQANKTKLAPGIKKVLQEYGMKGTISVIDNDLLVVTIKSWKLDIIGNYMSTFKRDGSYEGRRLVYGAPVGESGFDYPEYRPTHIDINEDYLSDYYSGEVKDFLTELKDAMNVGNYNMCEWEYFINVGWYTSIRVGLQDKPYVFDGSAS